jgi:hypothetical protein
VAKMDLIINTLYLQHLELDAAPLSAETLEAQHVFDALHSKVGDYDRSLYFAIDDAIGNLLDLMAREFYRRGFEDAWALKEELRAKVS